MLPAILAAVAAVASPDPPPVVSPVWVRRPTGDDFAAVSPVAAVDQGVSGEVSLDCLVAVDGKLKDCRAVSEAPAGYGFSDAALRLALDFQMRAENLPAGPARPHITVPIRFTLGARPIQAVTLLAYPDWISAPKFADVAARLSKLWEGGGWLRAFAVRSG